MAEGTDALLTIDRLAAELEVKPSWLYTHAGKEDGPPVVKMGKYLRFRRADVEAWLNARTEGR
jgi:predicted DNA-binding transcriptional regulator AlpA